ncbi:MAG: DNA methyltransferase [Acidiferrobacteraceae bacterium]
MRHYHIHPFPARMAPELALRQTKDLERNSMVLDPMAGSGTVLKAAAQNGHRCIGFDIDPLAVLMTTVATARLDTRQLDRLAQRLMTRASRIRQRDIDLPWFDRATSEFAEYWFAQSQRHALKKIAHVLHHTPALSNNSVEASALRIAVSRLIITKESGASLARDVSHSRPHRVTDENDFDVFEQFEKSVERIKRWFEGGSYGIRPRVRLGDARRLTWVRNHSIDMVMTSPPYLNAIDYMRGHRLSLIWLGYGIDDLRRVRSESIGAERGPDSNDISKAARSVRDSLGATHKLPTRHQQMVDRYCLDLTLMLRQVARVLKKTGRAVFVVGNSCLKDIFISNSRGVDVAAHLAGLRLIAETERKLPSSHRYLPMPTDKTSALGRRMRTETILTFKPFER